MAKLKIHPLDFNFTTQYAAVIWFSRRIIHGDQWYDLSELYKPVSKQTGIYIHKRDRQIILDEIFSSFRHTSSGFKKRMPNGRCKSFKIGFRFAIDQDIARLDDEHNPFEETLQLTDVEQERRVSYLNNIQMIRYQLSNVNISALQVIDIDQEKQTKNTTIKHNNIGLLAQINVDKRLLCLEYSVSKSDDELVEMLLRRDRRCGWYLRPDPNGTKHALEEYEPQRKEMEMCGQIIYKNKIYTRNKNHWKALMGIDVKDQIEKLGINVMNNVNSMKEIFHDVEGEEKSNLLEHLRSSNVVSQEIVNYISQVITE